MIIKDCDNCIKRKTMYCPNSKECYNTFEKPFHLNNIEALDQLQQKENIIKEIKEQLDYLETYSSKEDVYEDMSRRLNKIEKIIEGDSKYCAKEEK